MLLIYSPQTSPRLQYICKFIFEEVAGISYSLTTHAESFDLHTAEKICYSDAAFENAYHIKPHGLLFENNIAPQIIECFANEDTKCFFKTENADHPFDIFSAAFYLVTRYEECLPAEKDMYGRYAHINSLAYKEGFLKSPVVNIWLRNLTQKLKHRFPTMAFPEKKMNFIPTYDIDMAWSYREKGFLRNAVGFLKMPSLERLTSLAGKKEDPFDSYGFMDSLHKTSGLKPFYFFLVAEQNSKYDKNILPGNNAMQQLIKSHADKYEIGLHPSWKSNIDFQKLVKEKEILESCSSKQITSSRQHYIKFNLPESYENLLKAGITDDYSMGYGSINGFRASVASSFFWYNLREEKMTALRIHPFSFMDANCFYEEKLSVKNSYKELIRFYNACKEVNGTFITILHNNFLGTDKQFAGWKEIYAKFITQIRQ